MSEREEGGCVFSSKCTHGPCFCHPPGGWEKGIHILQVNRNLSKHIVLSFVLILLINHIAESHGDRERKLVFTFFLIGDLRMFEWYMSRLEVKIGHQQDTCYK